MNKAKTKVYFTIFCRKKIWLYRSLILGKSAILLIVFSLLMYINQGYLISTIVLFLTFFLIKILPMPHKDTIDVFYDRFIYKTKFKKVELDFRDIAFIDQDVMDERKGEAYYRSVEFLDESMKSLLFIEGNGYAYDDLVALCNRISTINQEYFPANSSSNALNVSFNENDLV
ncbi:hypothetical protein ACE1MS_22935 (plasmid) [Lysinibacillus sp. fkY74-1]